MRGPEWEGRDETSPLRPYTATLHRLSCRACSRGLAGEKGVDLTPESGLDLWGALYLMEGTSGQLLFPLGGGPDSPF